MRKKVAGRLICSLILYSKGRRKNKEKAKKRTLSQQAKLQESEMAKMQELNGEALFIN